MRLACTSLFFLIVFAGCPAPDVPRPPPIERFYSPWGLVHVDSPLSDAGLLFVANANVDKRFDHGAVLAVNLDRVALPPFGQSCGSSNGGTDGGACPRQPLVQITELNTSDTSLVAINNYAGEMAGYTTDAGTVMLFVPTRSEGNWVHSLSSPGLSQVGGVPELSCASAPQSPKNCIGQGVSMLRFDGNEKNQPRAPSPTGVGISSGGDVYITHTQPADTPKGALDNFKSYLIHLPPTDSMLTESSFLELGPGASTAVAVGRRWAYVSGRYVTPQAQLVRLVGRDGKVFNSGVEGEYRALESRGLAISPDEQHVYLSGRSPENLLVISVSGADSDAPLLRVERAVALPEGSGQVKVIARPGRGDLVLIVCEVAGVVAIYDHDVGDLVAQVSGVGENPIAMAVDERGPGARVYVSNYLDGRVAVIDIPDLARPQTARLVAHLGSKRLCPDGTISGDGCDGGTP